jgi:hypothetical protein
MTVLQFFSILFTFIVFDIVWARYTIALSEKKELFAAFYATLIPIFSGVLTIQLVDNHYAIIPMAIAGFIGTYISVRWL